MRICSLLPSATEICFALGLADSLVGVSHECDYPAEAARLPKVTRSNISSSLSSREIDSAVSSSLESQGTLYDLDLPLLESLRPDLIITQRLCDVCAVSFDRVQEAVNSLPSKPAVLNLEPSSLEDIFTNILLVADAAGARAAGDKLVLSLQERVNRVRDRTANLAARPRVFCMEWVDPPYCGGHWMKELVEIAGGEDALANPQRPSYRIEWERVLQFAPEVIVLTCCGFELERCEREGLILATFEGVSTLPALQNGRVYATDGSHFFSRPGPRIVESLEILAHLIHPKLFPPPGLEQAFKGIPVALPKSVCA
ncbi:MAG TPA: cobalamin-binding protein [Terriglobia bacterium]|nr:cobalamin-binding protein [Terriglobia bacterium]